MVETQVREICVNTTSLPLIQLDKDSVAGGELRGGNVNLNVVKDLMIGPCWSLLLVFLYLPLALL